MSNGLALDSGGTLPPLARLQKSPNHGWAIFEGVERFLKGGGVPPLPKIVRRCGAGACMALPKICSHRYRHVAPHPKCSPKFYSNPIPLHTDNAPKRCPATGWMVVGLVNVHEKKRSTCRRSTPNTVAPELVTSPKTGNMQKTHYNPRCPKRHRAFHFSETTGTRWLKRVEAWRAALLPIGPQLGALRTAL